MCFLPRSEARIRRRRQHPMGVPTRLRLLVRSLRTLDDRSVHGSRGKKMLRPCRPHATDALLRVTTRVVQHSLPWPFRHCHLRYPVRFIFLLVLLDGELLRRSGHYRTPGKAIRRCVGCIPCLSHQGMARCSSPFMGSKTKAFFVSISSPMTGTRMGKASPSYTFVWCSTVVCPVQRPTRVAVRLVRGNATRQGGGRPRRCRSFLPPPPPPSLLLPHRPRIFMRPPLPKVGIIVRMT